MNKCIRTHFLIIILFFGMLNLSAKEVDGYIIAKGGEKIYGSIRLTSVHYPTGAVSINNINYIPLYVSVFFKEKEKRKFKEYFAEDIDGFSFYYQEQQIFFFSIGLPIREWNQVKINKKFLRLIVNGYFILFDAKSLVRFGNNYSEVTDYYVSDPKNNIFNIADNDFARFEDFLVKQLKIDTEFLRNQPYKINARNIKPIIINYNQWMKRN